MNSDKRRSRNRMPLAPILSTLGDLMRVRETRLGIVLTIVAQLAIVVGVLIAFPAIEKVRLLVAIATLAILLAMTGGLICFLVSLRGAEQSSRRLRLLAEMNVQVNREILLNEDIELIYKTILDYLFNIFDTVTTGSILILGDDGYLTFAASRGFTEEYVRNFRLKLEDSFLYQEAKGEIREARLFTQADLARLITLFQPGSWEFRSIISAPIFVGDRLFGTLNLDSAQTSVFDAKDVAIVERFKTQIEVGLLAREHYRSSIERYHVDALTGLFTRRYFEDLFSVLLERAIRYDETFVVALFDADRLKQVNDSFGHLAGDQLLLQLAGAIRSSCRKSDIIGRFGGDEFIAVYHASETETIDRNIANILSMLRARSINFAAKEIRPSFSYGLACFPVDGKDLESLTEAADKRLYAMKSKRGSA